MHVRSVAVDYKSVDPHPAQPGAYVVDGSVDMGAKHSNLGEVLPGLNPNCRHHYIIQNIGLHVPSGDIHVPPI
jgi:hypothetical protein